MTLLINKITLIFIPDPVYINKWGTMLVFNELWIMFQIDAPRWLFKSCDKKIDVQYKCPKRLTKFPDIAPFDCLSGLNLFHFILDSSVNLSDEVEHRSITTVGVESKFHVGRVSSSHHRLSSHLTN